MSPATSTRWCPTPEQLMILEELYRRGLRTPVAAQIQRITSHLSFYGKIQGKNVFYWFQNHKARDRQKLRKKLAKQLHHTLCHYQFNRIAFDFPAPSPAVHQLPNRFSAQNLYPLGSASGVYEEIPDGVMSQRTWNADLPKDCLIRSSYGHDSMTMDAGPACPRKPLQTLELFPLRSSFENNGNHETTTGYFDDPMSKYHY